MYEVYGDGILLWYGYGQISAWAWARAFQKCKAIRLIEIRYSDQVVGELLGKHG